MSFCERLSYTPLQYTPFSHKCSFVFRIDRIEGSPFFNAKKIIIRSLLTVILNVLLLLILLFIIGSASLLG